MATSTNTQEDNDPVPDNGAVVPSARFGPSAPVLVGGLVLFGAAGLGLASIGGWIGLAGVFCLAAAMVVAILRVS